MGNKIVVKSSSLRYGRVALEEGFIEKYSQSFGDAERFAGMVHGIPTKRLHGLGKDLAFSREAIKQTHAWWQGWENGEPWEE